MMRRVDLLPAIYEQRRRERRHLVFALLAGLVVLLLLFAWYLALGFQVKEAQDDLAERQSRNIALSQQIAELQQFQELETEVQTKRTALQTVMAGDLDWPAIMTELAMIIPDDVWLTSLTTSAGATTGAAVVPSETNPIDIDPRETFGRILFDGSARSMRDVATWLIRLETVDEFLAVYLGSAERDDDGIVTFSSTLELGDKAVSKRFQQESFLDEDSP